MTTIGVGILRQRQCLLTIIINTLRIIPIQDKPDDTHNIMHKLLCCTGSSSAIISLA